MCVCVHVCVCVCQLSPPSLCVGEECTRSPAWLPRHQPSGRSDLLFLQFQLQEEKKKWGKPPSLPHPPPALSFDPWRTSGPHTGAAPGRWRCQAAAAQTGRPAPFQRGEGGRGGARVMSSFLARALPAGSWARAAVRPVAGGGDPFPPSRTGERGDLRIPRRRERALRSARAREWAAGSECGQGTLQGTIGKMLDAGQA